MNLTRSLSRSFVGIGSRRQLPMWACRVHYSPINFSRAPLLSVRHYTTNEPQQAPSNPEPSAAPAVAHEMDLQDAEKREPEVLELMEDKKIVELEQILDELQSKLRDELSKTDSMRKVYSRDVSRAEAMGVDKLAKKLFTVVDTLDICLQNKPDFTKPENENNVHAKAAFDGLQAAKDQFVSSFGNFSISSLGTAVGQQFDPMKHEALYQMPPPAGSGYKSGTIGLVLKEGWIHGDLLLRASSVGVVTA